MNYLNNREIKDIVKRALKEDIGRGDITTELTIPKNIKIEAVIIVKEKGIICGMNIAKLIFKSLDKNIKFLPKVLDGDKINKGEVLAKLYGFASNILTAERVALNFLGFLSGISTRTQEFVNKVKPYKVKIMDTRKTIPGLRALEKYAVRIGGGYNHRLRLDEMVLVKDNHIKVTRGYKRLQEVTRGYSKKIELEVKNLNEFIEALKIKPDIIMLDNMSVKDMRKAVKIRNSQLTTHNSQPKLEASGGINLKNIKKIAATGIDFISLGSLTKDIQSLDLSLKVIRHI